MTTETDTRAEAEALYRMCAPRPVIAARVGQTVVWVKGQARRRGWVRDASRVLDYLQLISEGDERWTQVRGAQNHFVSSLGRVAALAKGVAHLMRPEVDADGYSRVSVTTATGRKHALVHRLVAQQFVPGEAAGLQVAHRDGSRSNNVAGNLRWSTVRENHEDKKAHGTWPIGSKHPRAICTEAGARAVKAALRGGATIAEAAIAGSTTFCVAADISRGRTWGHVQ
jgi:hypothetical protein